MGLLKTVEWMLSVRPHEAIDVLRGGLERMNGKPQGIEGRPLALTATTPRSLSKNRWAATWTISVEGANEGSSARLTVEMAGNKHKALLDELAEQCGNAVLSREQPPSNLAAARAAHSERRVQ